MCDLAKNTERRFKLVFASEVGKGSHLQAALEGWPQVDLSKPLIIEDEVEDPFSSDIDGEFHALLQENPSVRQFEGAIKEKMRNCGSDERLRTLVLDEVRRFKPSFTKTEIQSGLDRLTATTAEEMFVWILSEVPLERRLWARKAIIWILFALRPLSPLELGAALGLSSDDSADQSLGSEIVATSTESALEETFRGLFFVGRNAVHLGHERLRDFLLAKQGREVWYDVNDSAHQEITIACLADLALPQTQDLITEILHTHPIDIVETPIFEPRGNLHEYAINYWPKHYTLVPEDLRPISHVLKIANNPKIMRNWSEALWLYSNPITRSDRAFHSPLPVFAGLGLEDVVERLFMAMETSAKNFPKDSSLALVEAVRSKHTHLVSTLLSRSAYDQTCLQDALLAATSHCNSHILTELITFAKEQFENFKWPGRLICRVAQFGHHHVLQKLFKFGASLADAETPRSMTPLHVAARQGHPETARILIQHGADLTASALFGRTPLHTGSVCGHPSVIKVLIEAGTEVGLYDEDKENALDLASLWGNHQVIETLCDAGIDMDRKDKEEDFTPLNTAAFFGFIKCADIMLKHAASTEVYSVNQFTPLRYATSQNNVEMCRLLLEHGADPNTTERGEPLLGDCAADGYFEIVKLLVENGAKIDTGSSEGWSALQRACPGGRIEIATYLLDHGAEVNHRSKTGQTPIITAANNSHSELVELLIERGGDVHLTTEAGWTASHLSYDDAATTRVLLEHGFDVNRVQNFYTPLFLAAANNHAESVKVILEFEPNLEIVFASEERQTNFTALTIAVVCGYDEIVRLLLEAGANINHKSEKEWFPILYAFTIEKEDVLRTLLEYHPDVTLEDYEKCTALNCINKTSTVELVKRLVNAGSEVNTYDSDGYTPLCKAVMAEDVEIVKYLVKKKAKLEVLGTLYGSPLHIACQRALMDIIKVLVEAGADVNDVQQTIMGNPLQAAARCWYARKEENIQDRMIRYLIEEGKADVKIIGGWQGCALNAVCGWATAEMVKLLLEKGAKVDVADSQGRVAMHYAAVQSLEHFQPIISAGADIEVKDKMERSTDRKSVV